MKPTVVLFDIDGTILSTGGAGRRSMERAFDAEYGRPEACHTFSFAGMTDQAIAREGISRLGHAVTPAAVSALLESYLRALAEEVEREQKHAYVLHDGVVAAVDACHARGFAVGLGTGNLQRGAELKLRRVGLHQRFDFGGFGDDHELRPELIRIGAERGAARLGLPLANARVVIVGDTPKDVDAARAVGAQSLTVATGGFSLTQLRDAGATWAFDSLAVPGALDALLHG